MKTTPPRFIRTAWSILACFTSITIWNWAERFLIIPPSESGKPGPWLAERARLFRQPLQVATARLTGQRLKHDPYAHLVRFIMICGPSQIGKTKSFLHPIIGYCVDILRTNCAFLTHKGKQIRQHLKVRMLPMFDATPRLRKLLPETESLRRERLAGQLWQLQGSNLHTLCANVASDLREYAHQVGLMDEPEAYDLDVEGEGDPIELFLDRQKRYADTSFLGGASTPNDITGHTWQKTCKADHRRLLVRCKHCGHDQELDVDRLRPTDPSLSIDAIEKQDAALWHCAWCDHGHTTAEKDTIVRVAEESGQWVPGVWAQDETNPMGKWDPGMLRTLQADGTAVIEDIGTWSPLVDEETGEILLEKWQFESFEHRPLSRRSYHMTYLHDIDCSNGRFLAHEISARFGTAKEWHTHVTGWRAEPILAVGAALEVGAIEEATGLHYRWGLCPEDAKWLLITADQQGNTVATCWFAYEVSAVNAGGEAWLVDAGVVNGFEGLEELENRSYPIGSQVRSCDRIAVDGSNGNLQRELYNWANQGTVIQQQLGHPMDVARRRTKRLLLLGSEKLPEDIPWRERAPQKRDRVHMPEGCRVFSWNKLHWKDRSLSRLRGDEGFPTFHIPTDNAETPKDLARWLKSQTSEERRLRNQGLPGGRQRVAIVWDARTYIDPHTGDQKTRSDTHWKDAHDMLDVLASLVGAYRLPGDAPPPPQSKAPAPTQKSPTVKTGPNAQRRKHNRKIMRRKRR